MTEQEFHKRFKVFWETKYPLVRTPPKNPLHAADDIVADINERERLYLQLVRYARQEQECGISRTKANKARRIFDEMGIDPTLIEFTQK